MARRAGATLACLGAGVLVAGLAAAAYIAIAPHYEPKRLAWWQAGLALNRLTPPEALVLIADDGDPTALYYSQRQGWHFLQNFGRPPVDSEEAIHELEQRRTRRRELPGLHDATPSGGWSTIPRSVRILRRATAACTRRRPI